jgi:hypothetical protein
MMVFFQNIESQLIKILLKSKTKKLKTKLFEYSNKKLHLHSKLRRSVRVVEGARLESVYAGDCIESSNLFFSSTFNKQSSKIPLNLKI